MADHGDPISYLVLASGTPVYGADGGEIGTVEHVLAVPEEDIFDGIVVKTAAGVRFVDAPQVDELYEHGVVLAIPASAAASLPEPSENPAVLDAGPDDTVPDTMRDKLKRAWDLISGNY